MKRLMTVLMFVAVGGSSCFSPVDVLLGVGLLGDPAK